MLFNTIVLSTLVSSAALVSALGPDHGSNRGHSGKKRASQTINKRTAGAPVVPADWPTTTQAGAIPSATAASASDPYLTSISDALNNNGNSLWTTKYTGDLTYYDTGSVACVSCQPLDSVTVRLAECMCCRSFRVTFTPTPPTPLPCRT